jgi:hypothetical protein
MIRFTKAAGSGLKEQDRRFFYAVFNGFTLPELTQNI